MSIESPGPLPPTPVDDSLPSNELRWIEPPASDRQATGTQLLGADLRSSAPFFITDALTVFIVWSICKLGAYLLLDSAVAPGFRALVFTATVYPLALHIQGLYPGLMIRPAEELKRVFTSAMLVSLVFLMASFVYRDYTLVHISIRVVNFALLCCLGVLGRYAVRGYLKKSNWWQQKVDVIGTELDRQTVITWLRENGQYGLAAAAPSEKLAGSAILATADWRDEVSPIDYRNIWHVEFYGNRPHMVRHHRNYLLCPLHKMVKRCFDVSVILLALPVVVPVVSLIAILVKLTSAGPVFYCEIRMGKRGKKFPVWKFRSMVANADDVLEKHLQENEALRAEWESVRKLKKDPRGKPR